MSPIGRVFIVINLILAGAFVVMAGTFLRHQDNWKTKHGAVVAELETKSKSFDARSGELTERVNALDTANRAAEANLKTVESERTRLQDENQNLKGQLAELAGDVKTLTTRVTSMDEEIKGSREDSKAALAMALEAAAARDTALGEKTASEASLAGAKTQIGDLETKLAEQNARIASLSQTVAENELIIKVYSERLPGAVATAQPDLGGVVEQAKGNICTVRITTNPGAAQVKPGYTLAIYKGANYKGEAVITEVDGEFAFCKITKPVEGMVIDAGDHAATNIGL